MPGKIGEGFPEEGTDLNVKGQTALSLRREGRCLSERGNGTQKCISVGLEVGGSKRGDGKMRSRPALDPAVS